MWVYHQRSTVQLKRTKNGIIPSDCHKLQRLLYESIFCYWVLLKSYTYLRYAFPTASWKWCDWLVGYRSVTPTFSSPTHTHTYTQTQMQTFHETIPQPIIGTLTEMTILPVQKVENYFSHPTFFLPCITQAVFVCVYVSGSTDNINFISARACNVRKRARSQFFYLVV